MSLFKVNTGLRSHEVCCLKWNFEVEVQEHDTSVFIIPAEKIKNKEDRLVVLNSVARTVIDDQRGKHEQFVFTYNGNSIKKLRTKAWANAWVKAGLPVDGFRIGPHNLKHTYGRRLRDANVHDRTQKTLMSHTTGDITDHYLVAQMGELIEASEKVVTKAWCRPELTLLDLKKK